MGKKNINIAPILPTDIVSTVSNSTSIESFGAQTKDKAKEILIIGDQTKIANIKAEIDSLVQKEQKAGIEKTRIEQDALYKLNTKQITQEQYNKLIEAASLSLAAIQVVNTVNRQKLQQDINNIVNSFSTKITQAQTSFSTSLKNTEKYIQRLDSKSKKDLVKQIVSNSAKGLVPIISLQIANSFLTIVDQRKKLEELVNSVNEYIDTKVKDQQTVEIATNLRNNAITLITNSIQKLEKLKKLLEKIAKILVITSLVIKLIYLIQIPLSPLMLKILIVAEKLVSGLSALLAIITVLLSNEIIELEELKNRLNQISLKLDGKTLENLNAQQISDLSNTFLPVGTSNGINQFPPYKGFNFKIKEEQNIKFVVKGNKRKYAVAIDRYGVEILKSEYSFTQDPNDLIEQLKLVIDQQNLQG
jgi:K+-transporting ATPase c subunit